MPNFPSELADPTRTTSLKAFSISLLAGRLSNSAFAITACSLIDRAEGLICSVSFSITELSRNTFRIAFLYVRKVWWLLQFEEVDVNV